MTKQQIKESLLICADENTGCEGCLNGSFPTSESRSRNCLVDLMRKAAEAIEPDCAVFDKVEEYENCTVQVLMNTKTGDVSVGWRKNE